MPVGTGGHVNFAGWSVDDRAGNGDGIANPGETATMPFGCSNTGDASLGPDDGQAAYDRSVRHRARLDRELSPR